MLFGYNGRLAEVNLSTGEVKEQQISEEILRNYIGGTGLGAKILWEGLVPGTDPLSEENLLLFLGGPYTATRVPCSGRISVVTKSPLTGAWAESDAGGNFATYLKRCGWDGVIVKGKAKSPSYLFISEEGIKIKNADNIWGEDTYKTHEILTNMEGNHLSTMSIGRAGERGVLLSSIVMDGKDARVAARCGVGAVMGSKKLKAVAVARDGGEKFPLYDEKCLAESVKEMVKLMVSLSKDMRQYGTSSGVEPCYELKDFPIKNWQERSWPGVRGLSGERLKETIFKKRYHCGNCPIGCGRVVNVEQGKYRTGEEAGGPEYETMGSLGGNLMIGDVRVVAKANDLCNRYGMDTISVGEVIGFSFEAYEKGYIDKRRTGGLALEWGNADAVIELVRLIGEREGLGEILGGGIRLSCEELAGGDPELNNQIKGLELPSHDPRAFYSQALGYATSPRGACHLQSYSHGLEAWMTMPELGFPEIAERLSTERKGEMVAKMQNLMSLFDSLKTCKFVLYAGVEIKNLVEWLNAITGWGFDRRDFLLAGERIFNLKTAFNRREGFRVKNDTLPLRFLKDISESKFERMKRDYYTFRGWNEEGIPLPETIERLGLTSVDFFTTFAGARRR